MSLGLASGLREERALIMVLAFEALAAGLLVTAVLGAFGVVVGFIRRVATGSWRLFGLSLLICVGGCALALMSFSAVSLAPD